MSAEYAPGDLALITEYGEPIPAVRVDANCDVPTHGRAGAHWHYLTRSLDGTTWTSADRVAARPLVVLDPEDREQVERLWTAFRDDSRCNAVDVMVDALRSLIRPPKPPEPQGLGAVVETPGGRYVRSDVETCNPWRGPKGIPFEWADLDGPFTILSEGVR